MCKQLHQKIQVNLPCKPGVLVHAFNLSTVEAGATVTVK